MFCRHHKVMKAFAGPSQATSEAGWLAQWEAQVLTAVVGLVEERNSARARIVCIDGGDHCAQQMGAQAHLVLAIRAALGMPQFPLRLEWIPFEDFLEEFGGPGADSQSVDFGDRRRSSSNMLLDSSPPPTRGRGSTSPRSYESGASTPRAGPQQKLCTPHVPQTIAPGTPPAPHEGRLRCVRKPRVPMGRTRSVSESQTTRNAQADWSPAMSNGSPDMEKLQPGSWSEALESCGQVLLGHEAFELQKAAARGELSPKNTPRHAKEASRANGHHERDKTRVSLAATPPRPESRQEGRLLRSSQSPRQGTSGGSVQRRGGSANIAPAGSRPSSIGGNYADRSQLAQALAVEALAALGSENPLIGESTFCPAPGSAWGTSTPSSATSGQHFGSSPRTKAHHRKPQVSPPPDDNRRR